MILTALASEPFKLITVEHGWHGEEWRGAGMPHPGSVEELQDKIKWLESCNASNFEVAKNCGLENHGLRARIQSLEAELAEQRHRGRWNVEPQNNGVRICRGEHAKTEACQWEEYESGAKVAALTEVLKQAQETIIEGYQPCSEMSCEQPCCVIHREISKALGE